jgi:hypothetical protein
VAWTSLDVNGTEGEAEPVAGRRLAGQVGPVRFSVNIPCFGDFADARNVARLATATEEAGWDGLFVWDHLVHRFHGARPFGDPWMLLTAAALATSGRPYADAGATGWDERQLQRGPDIDRLEPVLRRVEAGPPKS